MRKDNCPDGDLSSSYYDGECEQRGEQPLSPSDSSPNREQNFSPDRGSGEAEGVKENELLSAYNFAFKH